MLNYVSLGHHRNEPAVQQLVLHGFKNINIFSLALLLITDREGCLLQVIIDSLMFSLKLARMFSKLTSNLYT